MSIRFTLCVQRISTLLNWWVHNILLIQALQYQFRVPSLALRRTNTTLTVQLFLLPKLAAYESTFLLLLQISLPANSSTQISSPCLQTLFFLTLHTSVTLISSNNTLQHLKYLSIKHRVEKNFDTHIASEWIE